MRVLFTTQPLTGSFRPLVPLARALVAAGHEVVFACSLSYCPTVAASGFRCVPAGLDWDSPEAHAAFAPLSELPVGAAQTAWVWEHVFCGPPTERLGASLATIYETWPFDVVVRESNEFGGYLGAETLGLPHVCVAADPYGSAYPRRRIFAGYLAKARAQIGLPPDLNGDTLYRHLHLAFFPASIIPPDEPVAPSIHFLRFVLGDISGNETAPRWLEELSRRPTIHATLGTVFNREPAPVRAILAGLRDEPINLILTVGKDQDSDQYGPNLRTLGSRLSFRTDFSCRGAIWLSAMVGSGRLWPPSVAVYRW
ncbi:MAG: hypothetical protein M3R06_03790 [Chloroflexota bacterium]|nr:hypothetical protein [Chloroflexota bacterium]